MTDSAMYEQTLQEAVEWLVRHESAPLAAAHRQDFERWLQADATHQAAWQRVNAVMAAPLHTVRNLQTHSHGAHAKAAMQALFQNRRRRVLRGALAAGGLAVTAALTADRLMPLGQIMADLHTGTGERRTFTLADGSMVWLDARSAADVRYVPGGTQLQHRAGGMLVQHSGASPLSIRTQDGQMYLDAGRLMSRIHTDHTEVVAMEGLSSVTPKALAPMLLSAGEGVRFSAHALEPLRGNALDRASWQQGMLTVDRWSLAEVVQALQAYFPGFIRVAPSVADLQVFGVFRLDVDELLSTLAQTMPIEVRRLGPWVWIEQRRTQPAKNSRSK